jgi:hypothetical protein
VWSQRPIAVPRLARDRRFRYRSGLAG